MILCLILFVVGGFSIKNNSIDAIEIKGCEDVSAEIEIQLPQIDFVEVTPLKMYLNTDNLVFVGNSLVEGLGMVSNDNNIFFTKVGITLEGLKSNIYSSLQRQSCDIVVIGMGTNELGSYDESLFKTEYKDLINHIRDINKDSVIICLSIPPVSDRKSNNDSLFNNNNVVLYNEYIREIVDNENLIYIDNSEFFGSVLKSEWTGDGIHLIGSVYKDWYSFVLDKIGEL